MTKINILLRYLKDNPLATNDEISKDTGIGVQTIKVYLGRLQDSGRIIVDGVSGNGREVTVLETLTDQKPSFKREAYENMAEVLLEDFSKASSYSERVEICRILFKVLEKI